MKKMLKKIVAAVISMTMIMAMGVTAFAADEPTQGTLKVEDQEGNVFTAYQVMSSQVAGYDEKGAPLYTYEPTVAFKDFFDQSEDYALDAQHQIILKATGEIVLGDGRNTNTNTTETSRLANALEQYALNHVPALTGDEVQGDGASLDIGYYVIIETATAEKTGIASKPILVDLKEDVTVTPKDDTIDLEKKIVENNQKVDANNVSVGDTVNYEVTTAIPTYEANVDKTKLSYELTDTFSAGLTYQNDVVVKADDTELTKDVDYTITETEQSFVITLTQDAILNHQGAAITLTYTAILNPNAVVNSTEGNPNDIKLEYTNNPNQEDSKDTLEDETITYTYGFKIHKVDKNNETADMSGAEFEIRDNEGNVVGNFSYDENGNIVAGANVTINVNYAEVSGLDEGTYTITETKAPAGGYSILAGPVTVVIKDQGTIGGSEPNGVAVIEASGAGSAIAEITTNITNGEIDVTVKIVNVKGINLPETGAKTAMYCMIFGMIMIVLGGLFIGTTKFVTRKRK